MKFLEIKTQNCAAESVTGCEIIKETGFKRKNDVTEHVFTDHQTSNTIKTSAIFCRPQSDSLVLVYSFKLGSAR